MTPQDGQDVAHDERDHDERLEQRGDAEDPTRHPAPPGNPEADDDAVNKGEENLGRVVGR